MLYSWERGFIEDKREDSVSQNQWSPILLQKDEGRRSGKALTNRLMGKVTSETPFTVKTAAGAIYRKSDIAKGQCTGRSGPLSVSDRGRTQKEATKKIEDRNKSRKKDELLPQQQKPDPEEAKNKFQGNQTVVTSEDTEAGDGLNLAVKRGKPNNSGPLTKPTKLKWSGEKKDKKQSIQETSRKKCGRSRRKSTSSSVLIKLSSGSTIDIDASEKYSHKTKKDLTSHVA